MQSVKVQAGDWLEGSCYLGRRTPLWRPATSPQSQSTTTTKPDTTTGDLIKRFMAMGTSGEDTIVWTHNSVFVVRYYYVSQECALVARSPIRGDTMC